MSSSLVRSSVREARVLFTPHQMGRVALHHPQRDSFELQVFPCVCGAGDVPMLQCPWKDHGDEVVLLSESQGEDKELQDPELQDEAMIQLRDLEFQVEAMIPLRDLESQN